MESKTVIIGGGMAGISAALKLKEHKKDFIMITDTLGGRVKYLKEKKVNLGAYFVINNYKNVKKILKKEKWLNTVDALFVEDETKSFQTLSLKTLSLVPQILKFALILLRFGSHYKQFKKKCETMTHIEALKTDKYLTKLSNQSSADFIAEHKLQKLADAIIYKFAYGCTLTPAEFQSAFDLLTPCQGIIIPMYKFSFDEQGMADRLKKELVMDKVTAIEKKNNVYEVRTEKGKTFTSENIIMAASSGVAKQLLDLPKIRKNSCAYAFHIKGEPLEKYAKHGMNTFSSKYEISSITKEFNNTYLVYSTKLDTDFKKYFKKWEIIGKAEWDPAIYVYDNYLLEQNFNENITIAGDHNSCGMEPAAIAGIYAANRVLKNAYGVKVKKYSRKLKKVLTVIAVAAVVFILAYLPVISPFLSFRGATDIEKTMTLPGDELLPPGFKINMTHAVTVNATPDKIWPWMVQIGQDRAGFYSFEKLERLGGFGIHNTYRIVPEWQEMKPGDFIKFHKNGIGMLVHSVEKGKYFVLLTDSRKPMTPVPGQKEEFILPMPKDWYMVWNWSFNLIPLPDGKTRVIIRSIADFKESNFIVNWLFHFGSEVTGCVMNWQLINELKQCAEGEQDNIKIHL
jgi:hypothetical protein